MEPSRYAHQNSDERLRVLVVDDDLSLRKIVYRILESGGYDVLAASSGAEALAICRRSSPPIDLLVTDYNMPGMNGLELGHECAAFNSVLPVLYISGAHPDQELRAEVEKGKRGFLAKPFRREELLRKVKELLLMQPEPVWSTQQLSL
jgi:two-component system, cell cycle sensor histidine kinase and response regulator CckA